ncbi:hypothetical protein MTO96_007075 [Rhipicephalus appendiculatus]
MPVTPGFLSHISAAHFTLREVLYDARTPSSPSLSAPRRQTPHQRITHGLDPRFRLTGAPPSRIPSTTPSQQRPPVTLHFTTPSILSSVTLRSTKVAQSRAFSPSVLNGRPIEL